MARCLAKLHISVSVGNDAEHNVEDKGLTSRIYAQLLVALLLQLSKPNLMSVTVDLHANARLGIQAAHHPYDDWSGHAQVVGALAKALHEAWRPHVEALLEPMALTGLSQELVLSLQVSA